MSFTRRGILAAVALAQSNLLGGCFGGSDSTNAERGTGSGSRETATAEPTATATETATAEPTATATPTPVANAGLATATTNVLSEFEWLRTEYGAAIRGLRTRANRVIGVAEELEAAENLTQSDVTALRTATTNVANYVTANIVDHFEVDRALRVGNNIFVRDFQDAVNRDDTGLQDQVLSRTMAFYRRTVSRAYIEHEFSRRPVYDALYNMLVPGDGERIVALTSPDHDFVTWAHPDRTESSANDGIDQHVHEFPSGPRVFTHAHAHSTTHAIHEHSNEPKYNELYAYGDDGVTLLEDTTSWRERLDDYKPVYTGLFGPARSADREQGVYAFVDAIGPDFSMAPLYLERFASPAAAEDAVAPSTSAVSSEGTTAFAGREWARVFYKVDGTTIYAYRIRAGSTVITALPSDVPWDRRTDWTAGLGPTWIGTQSSDG